MVNLKGPLLSTDAHGSIGHLLTLRRHPRGHAAYPHCPPSDPNSPLQQARRSLYSLLAARWPDFNQAARDYWADLAAPKRITAYNAYLSHNLRRLNPAVQHGLLAWWPAILPFGPTLHDLTNNHYDSTLTGQDPEDTWIYSQARQGPVLTLNGDGYCTLAAFPQISAPFSVTTWWNLSFYQQTPGLLCATPLTAYRAGTIYNNKLRNSIHTTHALSTENFTGPEPWHHMAALWTGTQLQIWLDGSLSDTQARTTAPATQATLHIGRNPLTAFNPNWPGQIDDLRLYSRVLTPSEIGDLAAR